ncbi:MAG: hypothetical protein ACYS7Y_29280 [Planctomycetota bacterium]|jgi:hypothetical protein
MARIEMRDVTIYVQDGLSGTGNLSANASQNDATINVNTVVLNTTTTNLIPVGARLTINGETANTVHTVTARVPTSNGPTTCVTITPVVGAGTYNSGNAEGALTFINQRIEINVGEGNLTWTEAKEYEYLRNRGDLDTVKEADEQPVEMSMEFVYDYIKTQSGQTITPVDALKQTGEASEWVSSSSDLCEPYSVDVLAKHCVPCGSDEDEDVLFVDFRYESLDFDVGEATIAVSGRCNVSSPTVTRSTDTEC